jgi:hypothetical protein
LIIVTALVFAMRVWRQTKTKPGLELGISQQPIQ